MLHMFCNDFLSILRFFLQVFQTHVSCVSSVFKRILQMFHLDVLKVNWVLYMLQWRQWLTDDNLPQSIGSYLAPFSSGMWCPLLSSPPFPSLISPCQFKLGGDDHADACDGDAPWCADGGPGVS
jgi:hypothetical protein